MLVRLLGICLLLSPPIAAVQAQFSIPLPLPIGADAIRREDFQLLFLETQPGAKARSREDSLRARLSAMRARVVADATEYCGRHGPQTAQCLLALDADTLAIVLGSRSGSRRRLTKHYIKSWFPFTGYNRATLGEYVRSSGGSGGFMLASQFAANVGDDEAYLVSNIVRGIAGRLIFSTDYALVVTKAEGTTAAERDTIESDKANMLRAINNGGTLVARFTTPFHARSGTTISSASGLSFSAGFLGPIAEDDPTRRNAAVSGAAEALMSMAIRSLAGDAQQTAELVMGGRAGYTRSDGPLRVSGGDRDVSFFQGVVGLRQSGSMSVSALVTLLDRGFTDLVPRVVLSFSATR
jgi:hypothetical protein